LHSPHRSNFWIAIHYNDIRANIAYTIVLFLTESQSVLDKVCIFLSVHIMYKSNITINMLRHILYSGMSPLFSLKYSYKLRISFATSQFLN